MNSSFYTVETSTSHIATCLRAHNQLFFMEISSGNAFLQTAQDTIASTKVDRKNFDKWAIHKTLMSKTEMNSLWF